MVFFARCQPDGHGNCSVWGKASVETSDGRVLAKGVEVPLWVDRPPLPGDALGVSEHGVGLVVADFAGSYTFRVVVTDRVAGREVALVRSAERPVEPGRTRHRGPRGSNSRCPIRPAPRPRRASA